MPRLRISMPPDPNPHTPLFKAPPGACDTHCHVFGPPDLFPYAATRAYTPPAAPVEHYMSMLDIVGIDRGIIVQPNAHATDNAVSLDAIAQGKGRFRGICRLGGDESAAELKRLHDGGMRGARFNFGESLGHKPNLAPVEKSLPKMQELGWFIDVHTDPAGIAAYADTFRKFPVPVVIDHLAHIDASQGTGQRAFKLLLELLAEPKFWVKIAGIDWLTRQGRPYDDVVPFARLALEAAPDRVLWGTNWPHSMRFKHGTAPNDGDLVDFIPRFAPEPALQQKLLVANPARLFGF